MESALIVLITVMSAKITQHARLAKTNMATTTGNASNALQRHFYLKETVRNALKTVKNAWMQERARPVRRIMVLRIQYANYALEKASSCRLIMDNVFLVWKIVMNAQIILYAANVQMIMATMKKNVSAAP